MSSVSERGHSSFSLERSDAVRLDVSRDGVHVVASYRDGDLERCVIDGRALPAVAQPRGRSAERAWSPCGTRRAAVVREGGRARLVVSDASRDLWWDADDDVRVFREGFRDADGVLAFAHRREETWWVECEGGAPIGPLLEVHGLAWRGDMLVVVARDAQGPRVWIDGIAHACTTERPSVHVAHGAFALVDGTSVQHVWQGERRTLGPFARRPAVALAAGGRLVLAIVHDRDDTEVRWADGTPITRARQLRTLDGATGPRGDRLAFAYDRSALAGFYADGVHHDGFGYTEGPWWSAQGTSHLLWGGERGSSSEAFSVLDGRATDHPHALDWELGSSVRVTPRGEACVFGLDREHDAHWVHIGSRSYGPFPTALEPSARHEHHELVAFSADGAHHVFHRGEADCAMVHVDDGVIGPLPRPTTFTLTPAGRLVIASLEPSGTVVVDRRLLG